MKNYKFIFLFLFLSSSILANDITVTGIGLTNQNTDNHYTMVKFNISWNNSWRTSSEPNNWDAAWVFVKYKVNGEAVWKHATLNLTGNDAPSGSTITPASDGTGVFIYRSSDGSGNNSFKNVQLRWNYGINGVSDLDDVTIKVFAIEMVYIPQGSFYIGDGESSGSNFYKYPTITPYLISGEEPIKVENTTDNLYYDSYGGDQSGTIPLSFPKGFNAFYCMKYEITQQQYVDFLNTLTISQQQTRITDNFQTYDPSAPAGHYLYDTDRNKIKIKVSGSFITNTPAIFETDYSFVSCNYFNWGDVAAYLDWSCLRPMTELEFEKTCRGPLQAEIHEYAWGNTSIASSQYAIDNSGLTNEYISTNYSTSLGNAAYVGTINLYFGNIRGPVRVGIFAGTGGNTGRVTSGATYYGVMEMSGNLNERCVTIGNITGRQFTSTHGNGYLGTNGEANVSTWPPCELFGNPSTYAEGSGYRGGGFASEQVFLNVSDRIYATRRALGLYWRDPNSGGRGVRTAF